MLFSTLLWMVLSGSNVYSSQEINCMNWNSHPKIKTIRSEYTKAKGGIVSANGSCKVATNTAPSKENNETSTNETQEIKFLQDKDLELIATVKSVEGAGLGDSSFWQNVTYEFLLNGGKPRFYYFKDDSGT